MILVDTDKYWQMVRDQKLLQALEANGVDNWIGYEDCLKEVEEDDDEDDFLNGVTCNPDAPEECESCQ